MVTGADLCKLAESRLGQKYLNVLVPKNNPNWNGPWDCAEFVSWVVYQKIGVLFGCTNNAGDPGIVEAYSGAWSRDARNGSLAPCTAEFAQTTPGVVLIRSPPGPGSMGHVAISVGNNKVIEAAGIGKGVRLGPQAGRLWHFYGLVPNVTYQRIEAPLVVTPLPFMLEGKTPPMSGRIVREVQQALKRAGFDPGPIDGSYGASTVAAVNAFQRSHRLIGDGVMGPLTAAKLGIQWAR